jgi:hypothetical protein
VTFIWAVVTAEGSHYLDGMDDATFPAASPPMRHYAVVDIAHVRWATGNAITAIDLCAATLGVMFCGTQPRDHQLSLRNFDPSTAPKPERRRMIADRRSALPTPFLTWADDTLADARYSDALELRNPLTHASLNRVVISGPAACPAASPN